MNQLMRVSWFRDHRSDVYRACESVAVSVRPDDSAALLDVSGCEMKPARWGLADLALAPGYAGALVAQGRDWHVDCADWGSAMGGQGHV
jgi:hypothetical protein